MNCSWRGRKLHSFSFIFIDNDIYITCFSYQICIRRRSVAYWVITIDKPRQFLQMTWAARQPMSFSSAKEFKFIVWLVQVINRAIRMKFLNFIWFSDKIEKKKRSELWLLWMTDFMRHYGKCIQLYPSTVKTVHFKTIFHSNRWLGNSLKWVEFSLKLWSAKNVFIDINFSIFAFPTNKMNWMCIIIILL